MSGGRFPPVLTEAEMAEMLTSKRGARTEVSAQTNPPTLSERGKTIHNERVKLLATALNTLGTATVAGAVLAPIAAVFWGVNATSEGVGRLVLGSVTWFIVGACLHLAGSLALGKMK